jgi:putative ATP-dependent endonuclease of OLD family
MAISAIYRLAISRFRGINDFVWRPATGTNVILGGGDVGKTTILDAIGLLLNPTNFTTLSDFDYFGRKVDEGFSIEATIALAPEIGGQHQKPAWPWEWNGKEATVPSIDGAEEVGEAVIICRARGTPELDLVHEIVQPNGDTDPFHLSFRRSIGTVRLSGDDRNDRDLRLRSRLGTKVAKTEVKSELAEAAKSALTTLDDSFRKRALPHGLDLAVIGSQGLSIAALIGLTANQQGTNLPLSCWGAGTRRLASLTIAEQKQSNSPITLVDEVERGLEPYRQRNLIQTLVQAKSQAFVTTHSATIVSASSEATIWYVDHTGNIGPLEKQKIAKHQKREPETFLSRFSIVAEGITEVGLVRFLVSRALATPIEQHGIWVSDGEGHQTALGLLEALAAGGLTFGGFVDDENGMHPERWARLKKHLGDALFRWEAGCTETNIIGAVPDGLLQALVVDPDGVRTGLRLRTLADRLGMDDKRFEAIQNRAGGNLKNLIIEAATGFVPADKEEERKPYKAHSQAWFKNAQGGEELATKLFAMGLWPTFKSKFVPFINAARGAVGLTPITDITA